MRIQVVFPCLSSKLKLPAYPNIKKINATINKPEQLDASKRKTDRATKLISQEIITVEQKRRKKEKYINVFLRLKLAHQTNWFTN